MEDKSAWEIIKEKIPNIKIYLILITITLIAYVNILPNGFVWDDGVQIVNNQVIKSPGHLTVTILSDSANSKYSGITTGFYRPLMNFSFWLSYQIFGLNAWGFHLIQLFLHIINVLLVYLVIKEILKVAGNNHAEKIALLTASIFAVHPGISEAVQSIGATGWTLLVLFSLLSLFKLLTGINYQTREIQTKNIVWASIFGFFAYTSQETAVGIFVMGFVYLFLFLKPEKKQYVKYIAGGAITTLSYLFLRFNIAKVQYTGNPIVPIAKASLFERLITIPKEIVTYLGIFFWPAKLQIYQIFVVHSLESADFWLPLGIIMFIFVAIFLWLRKQSSTIKKTFLFFSVFYFIFLVPALNIIPLDMTVAERWQYLPSISLIVLLLLILFSFLEKRRLRTDIAVIVILFVVIPILTVRTIIRNRNWRSDLTLFGHNIKYIKGDNPFLEGLYGAALLHSENIAEAQEHLEKAVSIKNDNITSQIDLGVVYVKEGNLEKAKDCFERATKLGDYYIAYENLAIVLMKMNRNDEAKNVLEKGLEKSPADAKLYIMLAQILHNKGNKTEAKQVIEQGLNYIPGDLNLLQFQMLMENGQDINFVK